jgi:hypothetical protein
MGEEGATKTEGADRMNPIDEPIIEVLKLLPSRQVGIDDVFAGKRGNPMTKKWAEHNWPPCLEKLEIRHRKFQRHPAHVHNRDGQGRRRFKSDRGLLRDKRGDDRKQLLRAASRWLRSHKIDTAKIK